MLPWKPASMNPAVEWISRPSRPSELLPSSRATRSSGSVTRSSVWPSTNSPGWRMNGSSPSTSTGSVSSSIGFFFSSGRVEDERLLALHLDRFGELVHRLADVDERIARVAKDPETAVDTDVHRRRLD